MYELKDLKKDLKNKSIVAGTDYRSACSNVKRHVESSTKVVLKKRQNKAATTIQRQVRTRHRGKKSGHSKSCPADRIGSGLDTILKDLKMKLDTGERRLVESAMKNAGKKQGGCNTVAVKKLFDGKSNLP